MDSILGLLPLSVLFPIGCAQELLLLPKPFSFLSAYLKRAWFLSCLQACQSFCKVFDSFSLLSKALFVWFEPDGIIVLCTGFT